MTKLIITVGLPASGKTHWANSHIKKSGNYRVVCQDDLRAMLDNGKYTKTNEKTMQRLHKLIVADLLVNGTNVIVADTNLSAKKQKMWSQFAKERGATFERKSFLDVPLETCIKQDLQRLDSVGKDVIMKMYKQHVEPLQERTVYVPDESLPKAVICDIDGTIAHMCGRSPFDWDRVGEDSVDQNVFRILDRLADEYTIIMLSGRDGVCYNETEQWLIDNDIPSNALYMRVEGDCRKDSIIKEELFWEHVAPKFNVLFTLDDRNQMVDKWRSMGIKCLQVAEGDF